VRIDEGGSAGDERIRPRAPVTIRSGRHISGMKRNARKPLALDLHTVRALSGADLAGRVAGASMNPCVSADCSLTCPSVCPSCVPPCGGGGQDRI
jgi:hypothetical protein